ncbi:hypothetical protein ZIOFF_053025 [Zingiber officinale]|uniref:Uncharacterized protein n=1 Tax=Zingiber officinale TaxID=94328 RepID=A0A8J5FI09_ZINOF|nr:hypothetical protein ZIOFF_053025 [Zingiber officinale]
MGDASLISADVLSNLADEIYDNQMNATLEIECIVKQLSLSGEHDKIFNQSTMEFASSPQANHKKRELIGLRAATFGLRSKVVRHLAVDELIGTVEITAADAFSHLLQVRWHVT